MMSGKNGSRKSKKGAPDGSLLLYRIAKAMAAVKDGRELLKIIVEETQPVFEFHDIGLAVLDKSGEFYVDWSVFYEEINPSAANVAQREARIYKISIDEPLFKYGIARAEKEGKPFIDNMTAEFIEEHKDFPHLPLEIAYGYKQFLVTTLKFGGETLGILNFNSLHENHFDDCDFELFQAIADLAAVAVANIRANEEIVERAGEKSVLLSISEVIATVRSKKDLLQLIIEKIKPVFNFYDCGIFVFDREKKTLEDLAVSFPDISPSEASDLLFEQKGAKFDYQGSVWEREFELMRAAGKPVIVNYKNNDFLGWSDYVQAAVIEQIGYEESLMTILNSGGEELGVFTINSLEKGTFNERQFILFQNIANQMAVAVSNILANEEIMEREREKSVLLAITEQTALIHDKNDLMRVIAEKLQPIFGFVEAATVLYDKDSQATQNIKGLNFTIREDDALYNQMLSEKTSLKNSPYSRILRLKKPRINTVEAVAKNYPDFIGVKLAKNYGFREFVTLPLIYAEKLLGVFEMYSLTEGKFQPSQLPIYTHLADQIAVAVANILANEEISEQLAEINDLKKRLEAENIYLNEEIGKNYNFDEIIGTSPRLHQVFEIIETVAPTDATVLIQGETGTGKELVARAIHNRSTRNSRPLIKINCAALPRELIESELFGHERGSFTGAHERRLGKFELADKGTIFLDEIGELPLEAQVKLLRVLQEKEIERLGGKGTIKLDLRVVAATNRNLAAEVQAGRFRADLYYRLCTVELFMPSLRERREDIEPLTLYFAHKYAAKFSRRIERVSTEMLRELNAYDFPGNIRELEHIVEHAVIFSKNEKLILPRPLAGNVETNQVLNNGEPRKPKSNAVEPSKLSSVEREHIIEVLRQTSGRIKGKNGAAEILGLNPATLYFRMKKLGIEKK